MCCTFLSKFSKRREVPEEPAVFRITGPDGEDLWEKTDASGHRQFMFAVDQTHWVCSGEQKF